MEKITITLKISPDLWKEVQHKCVDIYKSYSDYVEEVLKKSLKKRRKKLQ